MKIAFYCPMKSPNHPVPSGDRLMARLLMQAMRLAGHEVEVVSELRSFLRQPDGEEADALARDADRERQRILALWKSHGAPDLWFCYHPYYKALDRLGPHLSRSYATPYVTAEASYSPKRNASGWAEVQATLLEDLSLAAVNICFTHRDRDGLLKANPAMRTQMLPPFLETSLFDAQTPAPQAGRMATVAMMRAGDKLSSYEALAAALTRLPNLDWTLDIIGDGPEREGVQQLFQAIAPHRLVWHGEKTPQQIAEILSRASLYLWPGHGEAYGLAYLEAQAAGLPVIAERIAGVPEVVIDGKTGILTEPGDTQSYADAITDLLTDREKRQSMADNARAFVIEERSLFKAASTLDRILQDARGSAP
ncbi:glycosyltransferase involved in cell wall biosynthesis [Agrobacterium larrymoorei]|uniref:Glycosyltransferase involved in cell wall biosynthesis n=1 Tax=Agrobacterium larrymoorei TaxID=160699 RepID=A0AAJ2BAY3_9HYPH|nr:glycosyltransferase family 4 protein [Agrobacterium larrymoorei]MDR6103483.1 glycosyltransferase involved in cell wall biosynthesis [Agrobacterium larrymoorei]